MSEAKELCLRIRYIEERIIFFNKKELLIDEEYLEYGILIEELADCWMKLYSLPGFIEEYDYFLVKH